MIVHFFIPERDFHHQVAALVGYFRIVVNGTKDPYTLKSQDFGIYTQQEATEMIGTSPQRILQARIYPTMGTNGGR